MDGLPHGSLKEFSAFKHAAYQHHIEVELLKLQLSDDSIGHLAQFTACPGG